MDTNQNLHVNTFVEGMNTDTAFDSIKSTQYLFGLNIRSTAIETDMQTDRNSFEKKGLLSPIYTNKYDFHVPDPTNVNTYNKFNVDSANGDYFYKIINSGDINVLLFKESEDLCIYKLIKQSLQNTVTVTSQLLFKIKDYFPNNKNNTFSPVNYNMSTLLHYEQDNVVILYIADGKHKMISINIEDSEYLDKLKDEDGYIDIDYIMQNNYFPNKKMEIVKTISGHLKTSQVQYTYRLYKKHCSCSTLAPLTNKIQIIDNYRNKEEGNAEDTTTSIGLRLHIPSQSAIQFDKVQIYRLQYIKANDNAKVQLIYDGDYSDDFYFNDIGKKSLQDLTIEEFSSLNGLQIIPSVIEQNQNYLFAANIKDKTIIQLNEDLDFKSYQFGINCDFVVNKQYKYISYIENDSVQSQLFLSDDKKQTLQNLQNKFSQKDYINPYSDINGVYDKNTLISTSTGDVRQCVDWEGYYGGSGSNISWRIVVNRIPSDGNGLLPSNLIQQYIKQIVSYDNTKSEKNRYTIKYNFETKLITNNSGNQEGYDILHYWKNQGVDAPNSYINSNNIYLSSLSRSLKRDEVYRYGIVLFDRYGSRSNVQWIADIRTPNINICPLMSDIYANTIGVEFTLSSEFKKKLIEKGIVSYEIVRCEKSDECTKNVMQVVLSRPVRQNTVKGNKTPYYPTGFITSQPQCIVQTARNEDSYWPKEMTNAESTKSVSEESPILFQIHSPYINIYRKNALQKIKSLNCELKPIRYVYGDLKQINDQLNYTYDEVKDLFHKEAYRNATLGANNKYSPGSVSPVFQDLETTSTVGTTVLYNFVNFKFGDFIYIDRGRFIDKKINKSSKVIKMNYSKSTSTVYDYKFTGIKGEFIENSEFYIIRYDSVVCNKLDLTKSYTIQNVSDVRNLNWEDGFTNHQYDGNTIKTATKKYKTYISTIGTDEYLNWLCSSKYDIPIGTDNEYGWTDGHWTDVCEFTNTGTSGKHWERVWEAYGPIGPGPQCLLINVNVDSNDALNKLLSHNLNQDYIKNHVIISSSQNIYTLGTLLCNIQHEALQFSGLTSEDKKYDVYYGFGNTYDISKDCEVFDGDTYVQKCELVGSFKAYDFNDDKDSLPSMQTIFYIPMETNINRYFDYGMNYQNTHNANLQLEPGTITGITSQDRPLNQYNAIYSDNNTSNNIYNIDSDKKDKDKQFKQRIFYSQLKTNGENIDNWQIFKASNFIDVDTRYGDITDLLTIKDTLYFWQTYAFGKLSVNERSLVTDNNNNTVQLGQGGVLQRADYISTQFGMNPKDMCKIYANGILLWLDRYNKCIACSQNNRVFNYSEDKNVQNLLNKYFDWDTKEVPSLTYDQIHEELQFSPIEYNEFKVAHAALIFNLKYNIATSIYSLPKNSQRTLQFEKDVVCFDEDDTKTYLQSFSNDKDGNIATPMCIKFAINANPSNTKVFDNQQIVFASYNEKYTESEFFKDKRYQFFTDLYNTSFEMETVFPQITNREGNINYPIPRAQFKNLTQSDIYNKWYGQRMRGKWMIETITDYEPTKNSSISHIITKFRQSYS